MAVMEFFTKYRRPETVYEPGGGEIITEQAGYLPFKRQVESMLDAGRRLVDSRHDKVFDIPEGSDVDVDDVDVPVDRRGGFDLADASQVAHEVEPRLRASRKAAKAAIDEKAAMEAKKDGRPSGEVVDDIHADEIPH